MKLLICASRPVGRMHPIVEVVDDMESFSPGLLANYPIAEVDDDNAYFAGAHYAREHGLTPIEIVISAYGHDLDDVWAFSRSLDTHRVYRATSPDGKLRMVAFRDEAQVDEVRLGLLKPIHPHYPLEGWKIPKQDVEQAIKIISDLWMYDLCESARAGQLYFPDGIKWGVIMDNEEWESSLDWMEDMEDGVDF